MHTSFIEFIELDQRLDRLLKEEESLAATCEAFNQQIVAVQKKTAEAEHKLHQLKKQLDMTELELKSISREIEQKEHKLAQAANPKEFFSLEAELKVLQEKKDQLEQEGFVVLEQVEQADMDAKKQSDEELAIIEGLKKDQNSCHQELEQSKVLHASLIKQRQKEEQEVDQELLHKYTTMRQRTPNPVVPIIKGSCSGCYYALREQDIIDAQKGKLIFCKDCHRMLYTRRERNDESI